jgi:putative transposase
MKRPLRLEFAGALYHITSRGNGRNLIYLQDDDFDFFVKYKTPVRARKNHETFLLLTSSYFWRYYPPNHRYL